MRLMFCPIEVRLALVGRGAAPAVGSGANRLSNSPSIGYDSAQVGWTTFCALPFSLVPLALQWCRLSYRPFRWAATYLVASPAHEIRAPTHLFSGSLCLMATLACARASLCWPDCTLSHHVSQSDLPNNIATYCICLTVS